MASYQRTIHFVCALIMCFAGLISLIACYAIYNINEYNNKQSTFIVFIFAMFLLLYGTMIIFVEVLRFLIKQIKYLYDKLKDMSHTFNNSLNSTDETLLINQV